MSAGQLPVGGADFRPDYRLYGFSRLENSIGLMEQFYQMNMSILCVMYLYVPRLNKYI